MKKVFLILCKEIYFLVLTNPSIYESPVFTGLFCFDMYRYYIVYKPYLVLSQFTSQDGKRTLADYFDVPKDVYPVGRLDHDSEGLLILTNDPKLNSLLLQPKHKHEREYLAQVEGEPTPEAIFILRKGVTISVDGKWYKTAPAKVSMLEAPPDLPPRVPPIRIRKTIPDSWLSLILTEGKNRQVRKMTAAVGYPTLRLVRNRIENINLGNLQPGESREWSRDALYTALFS